MKLSGFCIKIKNAKVIIKKFKNTLTFCARQLPSRNCYGGFCCSPENTKKLATYLFIIITIIIITIL